jgi:hypothetical protein
MRPLYLAAGHMLGSRPLSVGGTDLLQLHLAAGTGPYDRWSTNMTGGPVSYPNRTAVDRLLRAQIGPADFARLGVAPAARMFACRSTSYGGLTAAGMHVAPGRW